MELRLVWQVELLQVLVGLHLIAVSRFKLFELFIARQLSLILQLLLHGWQLPDLLHPAR